MWRWTRASTRTRMATCRRHGDRPCAYQDDVPGRMPVAVPVSARAAVVRRRCRPRSSRTSRRNAPAARVISWPLDRFVRIWQGRLSLIAGLMGQRSVTKARARPHRPVRLHTARAAPARSAYRRREQARRSARSIRAPMTGSRRRRRQGAFRCRKWPSGVMRRGQGALAAPCTYRVRDTRFVVRSSVSLDRRYPAPRGERAGAQQAQPATATAEIKPPHLRDSGDFRPAGEIPQSHCAGCGVIACHCLPETPPLRWRSGPARRRLPGRLATTSAPISAWRRSGSMAQLPKRAPATTGPGTLCTTRVYPRAIASSLRAISSRVR